MSRKKKENIEEAKVVSIEKKEETKEDIKETVVSSKEPSSSPSAPPLKQQLKDHLQIAKEVIGYSVVAKDKEGFHNIFSTYPRELNDVIMAYHAGALTPYEVQIVKMIGLSGLSRIEHIKKMHEEQDKDKPKIIK